MRVDEKGHFYYTCEICGSETRFGPDLYQGRVLQLYGIGGAIRVNLLFCPAGKMGFLPPPDDRIPPAITPLLIGETYRKKDPYL